MKTLTSKLFQDTAFSEFYNPTLVRAIFHAQHVTAETMIREDQPCKDEFIQGVNVYRDGVRTFRGIAEYLQLLTEHERTYGVRL